MASFACVRSFIFVRRKRIGRVGDDATRRDAAGGVRVGPVGRAHTIACFRSRRRRVRAVLVSCFDDLTT